MINNSQAFDDDVIRSIFRDLSISIIKFKKYDIKTINYLLFLCDVYR